MAGVTADKIKEFMSVAGTLYRFKEGPNMHIEKIEWQVRRDFAAIYRCEHCGYSYKGGGYDDANFHHNVVPKIECPKCGKTADETYRPLTTKYPEGFQI